jgi:hypothetical protein
MYVTLSKFYTHEKTNESEVSSVSEELSAKSCPLCTRTTSLIFKVLAN